MKLYIPNNYNSILTLKESERAIKMVKDFFEQNLAAELKLRRVTAPLFVQRGTGINDDLNGTERPVSFEVKDMDGTIAEIVHSLAKWKRMMLADYEIANNYGLYTDMNALRPDEELDNIHSIYVDQWDWEKILLPEDRNIATLKTIVNQIYSVIKRTEFIVYENHPDIVPLLPDAIHFIHAEELLERFELTERRDSLGGELSRGMRQKLAFCCAWLPRPALVLLDEPLSGLDPRGIRSAKQAVRDIAGSGTGVILSSHLLELIEELAHRILILDRGRRIFLGTLEEARATLAPGDSLEEIFMAATGGGEPEPGEGADT